MNIEEAINKRISSRRYLKRKVKDKDILSILEAAHQAPNAGNIQNWKFIVVKDSSKKEALTKAALNQKWMNVNVDTFIVICSDSTISKKFYPKQYEKYDSQSCSAATQNMLLRATSLGLGSCWIGAFDSEAVSRELSLPETATPQVIITLGYIEEKERSKTRKPLNQSVYFEEWGNKKRV